MHSCSQPPSSTAHSFTFTHSPAGFFLYPLAHSEAADFSTHERPSAASSVPGHTQEQEKEPWVSTQSCSQGSGDLAHSFTFMHLVCPCSLNPAEHEHEGFPPSIVHICSHPPLLSSHEAVRAVICFASTSLAAALSQDRPSIASTVPGHGHAQVKEPGVSMQSCSQGSGSYAHSFTLTHCPFSFFLNPFAHSRELVVLSTQERPSAASSVPGQTQEQVKEPWVSIQSCSHIPSAAHSLTFSHSPSVSFFAYPLGHLSLALVWTSQLFPSDWS
mmetsp:Transcript_25661/g.50235  ORF Transcript_25661/g.50235 Transcript_25661/m.50235 type:complete len:272 (+) Transcript_25661:1882-2697(+)